MGTAMQGGTAQRNLECVRLTSRSGPDRVERPAAIARTKAVFWALRSLHGNAGVAVYLNLQSVRLNCARHTVLQTKP